LQSDAAQKSPGRLNDDQVGDCCVNDKRRQYVVTKLIDVPRGTEVAVIRGALTTNTRRGEELVCYSRENDEASIFHLTTSSVELCFVHTERR
jgi:hypothetical protein